ncbi:MAG: hypothetical protein OEM32_10300 [Acidimicrobiia bacterium]|nr:hypothetical protein [Acidimicrobiia bacterium]
MTAADATGPGVRPTTPKHLWIVGILALLWNFMGVFDYLATQFKIESYMGEFTQEQLDYFYGFPAWAVSGWAIAVWIGLAGTVGLLLRRKWSVVAFAVSLAGLALSSIYTLVVTNGLEIMGSTAAIMTVVIWVVSFFLVWYSNQQAKAGILV